MFCWTVDLYNDEENLESDFCSFHFICLPTALQMGAFLSVSWKMDCVKGTSTGDFKMLFLSPSLLLLRFD